MVSRTIVYQETGEERLRSRLHTHLEQDGGNPSQLLEMLVLVVERQLWKTFDLPFRAFIENSYEDGGLGWSIENLKTVLDCKHRYEHDLSGHPEIGAKLRSMRQQVTLMVADLGTKGGDRRSDEFQSDNYHFENERGTSADYLSVRLARDFPEIFDDLNAGKYRSVRQAAIEAGIIHPRQRYSLPDEPQAAGRYLAQRVDKEWLLAMVDEALKAL
jgi:hypothetical protein